MDDLRGDICGGVAEDFRLGILTDISGRGSVEVEVDVDADVDVEGMWIWEDAEDIF
jgi:hypothetical protein